MSFHGMSLCFSLNVAERCLLASPITSMFLTTACSAILLLKKSFSHPLSEFFDVGYGSENVRDIDKVFFHSNAIKSFFTYFLTRGLMLSIVPRSILFFVLSSRIFSR